MLKGHTFTERLYPTPQDFLALTVSWGPDAYLKMVECVWKGYDAFRLRAVHSLTPSLSDNELERDITQSLAQDISDCVDPFSPFMFQSWYREFASRMNPPAQSPEYDMAFVVRDNRQVCWPIEAKVLRTDRSVAPYVRDLKEEYLKCRYAPFSTEGCMMGFLFKGSAKTFFLNISNAIGVPLTPYISLPSRNHNLSDHVRPCCTMGIGTFRCHHLVLEMF